jgi:pimeloyl-ACP methyl ester carboxylesterase
MGGKTAMAAALNYPEVIEGLVVVDVSPHKAPGKGESTNLIRAMKNLDLSSLTNRREADAALENDIKVGGII